MIALVSILLIREQARKGKNGCELMYSLCSKAMEKIVENTGIFNFMNRKILKTIKFKSPLALLPTGFNR